MQNDNIEMVKLLYRHGADICAKNIAGITPIQMAVKFERKEILEAIKEILNE